MPRKSLTSRAERNCAWIERYCRVPEGAHVGKPVVLRAWQRRELVKIYDNPAGDAHGDPVIWAQERQTALAAFLPNSQLCSAIMRSGGDPVQLGCEGGAAGA